jgi:hypothetical protein
MREDQLMGSGEVMGPSGGKPRECDENEMRARKVKGATGVRVGLGGRSVGVISIVRARIGESGGGEGIRGISPVFLIL